MSVGESWLLFAPGSSTMSFACTGDPRPLLPTYRFSTDDVQVAREDHDALLSIERDRIPRAGPDR